MKNSTTSWVAACGLLLAACTFNQVSPDRIAPIAEYRSLLDGTVRPDMEVIAFGRSDELFPVRVVRKGPALVPLRQSSRPLMPIKFQSDGKNYDLFDYLSLNRVAGLLVLKDGEISFEDYELGIDSSTRWASFWAWK